MPRNIGLIKGAAVLAAIAIAAPASAQLTQVWRTDGGAAAWFPASGDTVRGMCYNPVTGNLLVPSRQGGTSIQVLNAGTGAVGTAMNVTGISGSSFQINKMRTVDLGGGNYAVYAASLTTNAQTAELCIYRWTGSGQEDSLGAPTVIFRQRGADAGTQVGSPVPATIILPALGAARYGDTFDVASNGTTTQFYFGVQGAPSNQYLKLIYTEGDAAVSTLSQVTLSGLAATASTVYAVHPDGYDGNIYTSSNLAGAVARFSNDGTLRQTFQSGHMAATITHINVGTINGVKMMGYIDGDSIVGGAASPYRRPAFAIISNDAATDSTFEARESFVGPALATAANNGNGTGEIYFDDANDRIYIMVTNNYLGAYSFTTAAPSTVTWDGGASTSNWFDAANWSGDAVPTYTNDVVLDNSTVAGAYSVVVNGTNGATAHARSLSVGPAATSSSTITLQVPALTTATASSVALLIAGEQTTASDLTIGQFGRFEQLSTAFTGNIVDNRNLGNSAAVADGAYFLFDSPRSFVVPFPASGDGAVSFGPTSTLEFGNASPTAFALGGRSLGNLTLNATAAKTFTSSGPAAAVIAGNLTAGPNVTYTVSMTGGLTIGGNVVNNGTAMSLTNTGGGMFGVTFTSATATVGGTTATAIPYGFTVPAGKTLTLNHPVTTNVLANVVNYGTLNVNDVLTVNYALFIGGPIGGTGTIDMGASTTVETDMTDLSSVTLTGGLQFDPNGKVVYTGSTPQNTTGIPATVKTITLANPAGLTLSAPLSVGTLILIAGEIDAGPHTLTNTTTWARTSGHVIGTFAVPVDATTLGTRTFPVGTAGAYTPVSVEITSAGTGTGTIAVSSAATAAASLPASVDEINRHWTITQTGISGATYTLGFTYEDGDLNGVDENTLVAAHFDGANWGTPGTSVVDALGNTVTVSGITALSPWTLYKTNPIPGVSSGTMNFGTVTIGNTPELTFDVTNSGTAPFNVTALNFGATGYSVVAPSPSVPFAVDPGVPVTVTVRFTPAAATLYSDTLTVDTDAATDPTVSLSGTGASAVNDWMMLQD